jgi:hypothetical protein
MALRLAATASAMADGSDSAFLVWGFYLVCHSGISASSQPKYFTDFTLYFNPLSWPFGVLN